MIIIRCYCSAAATIGSAELCSRLHITKLFAILKVPPSRTGRWSQIRLPPQGSREEYGPAPARAVSPGRSRFPEAPWHVEGCALEQRRHELTPELEGKRCRHRQEDEIEQHGRLWKPKIKRNYEACKEIAVTTKSWNSRKKMVLSSTATVQGATKGSIKTVYHAPGLFQGQVQAHAKNRANEMARHHFPIEADAVGTYSAGISRSASLN
jgi:hypothetical protein